MAANSAAEYTSGEMKALIAPLLGIDPEDLDTICIIAISRQRQLAVQSNIEDVYTRIRLLLATLEYELHVHTEATDVELCECDLAPGPHPRTDDCPEPPL